MQLGLDRRWDGPQRFNTARGSSVLVAGVTQVTLTSTGGGLEALKEYDHYVSYDNLYTLQGTLEALPHKRAAADQPRPC